ncbi:MAG: hypothetical protein ABI870_06195 [Rhodanobacter sp.]
MKTQNLLASIAAVLITSATLGAVSKNDSSNFRPIPSARISTSKITNLAPVNVYPSAEERREASLLVDASIVGMASMPTLARAGETGDAGQYSLIGAQLAMPYYSFGNKFGRISKE